MTKLLIGMLCIVLSGCMHQIASNTDISKAVEFCGAVKNIEEIQIQFTGVERVRCRDGRHEFTENIVITKGDSK